MNKISKSAVILILFLALYPLSSILTFAQRMDNNITVESLFLDLQKVKLGTLSGLEEKKRYMITIELEKQRIQTRMLHNIYENAFALYKSGDFEGVQELTGKILSIDPNFRDASLLLQASGQLKGRPRRVLFERMMIEDQFKDGLLLYRQGRLVEASRKWEDVVKLSPGNLKARHWLGKVNDELAEEHFRRGEKAYAKHRLKEALDRWYSALLLKPNDRKLTTLISKTENEIRDESANEHLRLALDLYGQGKLIATHEALKEVQQIQPGNPKSQKLLSEVRTEIVDGYISKGRKFYRRRKYTAAISEWKKAKKYGGDVRYVNQLVTRAKAQMKREAKEKKRALQQAKRDAEEAKRREAEEREAALRKARMQPRKPRVLPVSGPSEENRRAAQYHYLEGLKYFQNGNMQKARDKWTIAMQLDPGQVDADAGLKRIDQMLGGE